MSVPSFLGGAAAALIAVSFLFAAPRRMISTTDQFEPRVYYVVDDQRFDWFNRDPHRPNALGGFTLDGRRISAVWVSRSYDLPDGEDDGVEE